MKKTDTMQFMELSKLAFGHRYYYRRILRHGIRFYDKTSGKVLTQQMTPAALRDYMEKLIEQKEEKNEKA